MEKMKENEEKTQEIRGVLYEENKIQQVYRILNTIPVAGDMNIKAMSTVFEILSNPIPFNTNQENKQ